MEIQKKLDKLLTLLNKENLLLKKGISETETADELLKITEAKRKMLAELAEFEAKDMEQFKEKFKEMENLNKRNQKLLLNNTDILEETIKTLIPEEYLDTYSKNGKITGSKTVFGKKA